MTTTSLVRHTKKTGKILSPVLVFYRNPCICCCHSQPCVTLFQSSIQAPLRHTRSGLLSAAVFRPWHGSQAPVVQDLYFNTLSQGQAIFGYAESKRHPHCSGLWVQGTADPPASTEISTDFHAIIVYITISLLSTPKIWHMIPLIYFKTIWQCIPLPVWYKICFSALCYHYI